MLIQYSNLFTLTNSSIFSLHKQLHSPVALRRGHCQGARGEAEHPMGLVTRPDVDRGTGTLGVDGGSTGG